MKLDKHVVDMFTELTKPADDVKMEKTCYGTISVVDGTRYVKLDGSDLLVPAASTVKTSHGDRVTVLMKNHSLTVTGNLTAPATDGEGGSSGEAGTAATIEVGTVTTGEAGSSATVTNVGTTSAAIFDFVIPRGDKGEKGDTGTWDGTIPDHEHTVSDITDFPTTLPANGGNADTLDGLHAGDFSQIINLGNTSTDTKTAIGIPGKTTTYWCSNWTDYPAEAADGQGMIIAAHYNGDGTAGVNAMWVRQLYITPHLNYKVWQRVIVNTTVGEWTSIADGGNAATVNGRHSGRIPTQNASGNYWNENSTDINDAFIQWDGSTYFKLKTVGRNLTMVDNADTLDGKHANEFLYADGFAGQLAKLFSKPANDTELATVFSVAPDNATLDTLNPGIYVVNTAASRRSLGIPNEITMGGPNGTTVDNSQCIGGILIKLGSILGKPGFYTTVSGQATDRPYTTSCAFFISNNGSIYRAIESINQGVDHTGAYMYARWTWKAFVFDLFSNTYAYTIQSIEYINTDVTLAPGKTYVMYSTVGQFALPYTRGTAYGPTKRFPLKSSSSNPNLCIINTSRTENLIIPAGRYLIHAE